MEQDSWLRVDQWWAERMGVPVSTLWQTGVTVSTHAGLGDFNGIAVSHRDKSVHVLLPDWADAKLADRIRKRDPSELLDRKFWLHFGPLDGRSVSALMVHSYTDQQLDAPKGVEQIVPSDIADWEGIVSRKKWEASGFAGKVKHAFAIRSGDAIAAASGLTKFMGGSSNVGVLTHPAHRGKGFATRVARAATAYAVQSEGIARFRFDADNARSRSLARALTFEAYSEQLRIE